MRNETPYSTALRKNAAGPRAREQDRRHGEPGAQTEQRRPLEPGRRLAPQELVAGRDHRDVAEDRRHARRGRRALQPAGPRRGTRRLVVEAGEDDRDGAEDRAVEHHPVMALAVGQDAEDRDSTSSAR